MRRRLIASSAALGFLATAGAWFWSTRPLTLPVAQVEQDVPVRVFGLGTIEAQISSRIGFEVAGTLTEVLVDHGDQVRAGQVLARLNTAAQQVRVLRAQAGVQSAEAHQARVTATLERATAQMHQKRSIAARRRELAGRGTASVETAEVADTEAALAVADLAVATADMAVALAALAEARANLQTEQTALIKHTIVAPYDARIINRHREPGSALGPSETVFTLIDPRTIWALAHVDEGRAGGIEEGQKAEVRLRSLPGAVFAGRVVRIGLESDRVTEERRVYVRCETCPPRVVLGEQAQVEIQVGHLAKARLVPEAAVVGFDGATGKVWTINAGTLRQRDVRFVARTLDARLALDPAVAEDWAVVTRIPRPLRDGWAARAQ
jgi:HlyD family secretion protein